MTQTPAILADSWHGACRLLVETERTLNQIARGYVSLANFQHQF